MDLVQESEYGGYSVVKGGLQRTGNNGRTEGKTTHSSGFRNRVRTEPAGFWVRNHLVMKPEEQRSAGRRNQEIDGSIPDRTDDMSVKRNPTGCKLTSCCQSPQTQDGHSQRKRISDLHHLDPPRDLETTGPGPGSDPR